MKLFDVGSCARLAPAQKTALQKLDAELRAALGRFAQDADADSPGSGDVAAATLLLSVAADAAFAAAGRPASEEEFLRAARAAYAWARRRHSRDGARLAA
jgi:hypothetical protein